MSKMLISMWVGIALLVASWLFPPWLKTEQRASFNGTISAIENSGHSFIFSPPQGSAYLRLSYQIDLKRVLMLDLAIVAITAGAIITFRKSGS